MSGEYEIQKQSALSLLSNVNLVLVKANLITYLFRVLFQNLLYDILTPISTDLSSVLLFFLK